MMYLKNNKLEDVKNIILGPYVFRMFLQNPLEIVKFALELFIPFSFGHFNFKIYQILTLNTVH